MSTESIGRQQVETVSQNTEEQFRAIFAQAAVGIAQVHLDGTWLRLNNRFCEMLGYTQAELLTKTWIDISHPDDRDRALAGRLQLLAGEITSHSMEKRYIRKDGTILWGRLYRSLVRDDDNQPRYLIAVLEDISERIIAEHALLENQRRLALALRAAQLGVWECNLRADEVVLSPRYRKGHYRDPMTRAEWLSLVHPDDREQVVEAARGSLAGTLQWDAEFRVLLPDGNIRWMHSYAIVLVDEAGQPDRMVGVSQDVTGRKQAEVALRESETKLTEAQRLAKVGSWELDVQTKKLRWSSELFRIYGLTTGSEPDFPAFLVSVHPDDHEKIMEAQVHASRSEAPCDTEFRFTRPDGEVVFVRATLEAIRDEQGILSGFRGATQDITDRVRANESLRESERRLSHAERIAHVGHWDWDIETHQVSWSAEMLRILRQPEAFTPSLGDLFQIIAVPDRNRMEQWITDCLQAKRGSSIEVQIMRADGNPGTLSIVSEVVLDETGRPARMFGSCQDVTESRRAQEELFARQKLESLGTLASGIAHDFNNLLGAVMAQAELAMAENEAGSDSNEQLTEIRRISIRGSEIVRQLMIYAGNESDKPEAVDVSKAVEEMLGLLKASVSKHAVLVAHLGADLPPVTARTAQIRQIVINLVVNASEAIGDRDGAIRVTTRRVTIIPDVSASTESLGAGDYVELEVSDTGGGVSPETQARMFEPFFSTKSAGRGLGLAVVQGIVRSLHGEIRVASDPGTGTSFQILLPCASVAAHAGATAVTVIDNAPEAQREATVLIVEDEDPLRLAVGKILGKARFEVLEAANGNDAVALLRAKAKRIDVLLLDVTIPGCPSHEVLAEAVEAQPDMKVILTSAYPEEMARAALSAPQVRGFVRKPFQTRELVRVLRDVLDSNR